MISADPNSLCLECGLCCNGVIFARGELQAGDDAERLQANGLKLLGPVAKAGGGTRKFRQPCGAFDGCRCRVYAGRPAYCRAFDCLLLKSVKAGERPAIEALKVICAARRRVERAKKLLHALGEADDAVAISHRFRKLKSRLERGEVEGSDAERFGRLTLAMHDLNLFLRRHFYNG